MKKSLLLVVAILAGASAFAQKKPMREFVDDLMSKMTLEEKIGQLNLLPGNDITTGEVINSPLAQLTEEGEDGGRLVSLHSSHFGQEHGNPQGCGDSAAVYP